MPDSLLYDDVNHLSRRIYWSDSGGWRGDMPFVQIGLVFLNLVLVAIGLGYSWIHHRWAGMIPMTIFIAYSVSLSAAMNSGGRYLVPMDWVLYFYYGLAIVVIVRFVLKVLAGLEQSRPASLGTGAGRPVSERRKLGFSLAGIIFLASLIPIANFVLPVLTPSTRNQAKVEAVRASISAQAKPGTQVVYGEILYPYYEKDLLTFSFLTPTGVTGYVLPRTPAVKAELSGGERAFLALRSDNKNNLQMESIYLLQNASTQLIWHAKP